MASWRAPLAAALALAACRARYRPPPAEAPEDVPAADASADADVVGDDAPLPQALATVTAPAGEVRWDPNHRCRGLPRAEGGAAAEGRSLLCGDRVTTGAAGRVTVRFAAGTSARVGASGVVEVPAHAGAQLVVARGLVRVEAPFEATQALRVDTPAARVIVSSGEALVAVAADGAVRVVASSGAVTAWPAGAAVGRAIDAGAAVTWSVTGEALAGAPSRVPAARAERALRAWVERRDALTARGASGARAALTQAAAADERAAREAMARLRGGAGGRDRDAAEGALSLALGRLHARARCAQGLDASALAGFEALRDEARAP